MSRKKKEPDSSQPEWWEERALEKDWSEYDMAGASDAVAGLHLIKVHYDEDQYPDDFQYKMSEWASTQVKEIRSLYHAKAPILPAILTALTVLALLGLSPELDAKIGSWIFWIGWIGFGFMGLVNFGFTGAIISALAYLLILTVFAGIFLRPAVGGSLWKLFEQVFMLKALYGGPYGGFLPMLTHIALVAALLGFLAVLISNWSYFSWDNRSAAQTEAFTRYKELRDRYCRLIQAIDDAEILDNPEFKVGFRGYYENIVSELDKAVDRD